MILERHYQKIVDAYSTQSFYPEKRAEQIIAEYSSELEEDLRNLENPGNYQEKYESKFLAWIAARARCMSPMITGPANFPVARNNKHLATEDKRYKEFREWRERYFKAVNREKTLSPEEEIDKTLSELDKQVIAHETMKGINKIIQSKCNDDGQKKSQIIEKYGLSEENAEKILEPDYMGCIGFASYALVNSNARIKRLREKLDVMRARVERKETWEPITFDGGVIDIEADRVIIQHNEKPARDVIEALKSKGFRWSRNYGNWSRKHTARAVYDAKILCGVA